MRVAFVKLTRCNPDTSNPNRHWRAYTFKNRQDSVTAPCVIVRVPDDMRATLLSHTVNHILTRLVVLDPEPLLSTDIGVLASHGEEDPNTHCKLELVPRYSTLSAESTHAVKKIGEMQLDDETISIVVMYQTDSGKNAARINSVVGWNNVVWESLVILAPDVLRSCYANKPTLLTSSLGYGYPSDTISDLATKIADFMDSLPVTGEE